MLKLIMLFLIVFIYEKSFSQTCRDENPQATVDYPAQLGDLLARGFKGYSGGLDAEANRRQIVWGTISNPYLGIDIRINYDAEIEKFDKDAKKYVATINWAIKKIYDNNPLLIEKLRERPLEFYLVIQRYSTGFKVNDLLTPWGRQTHMVDFSKTGVTSFTHTANWSRVNKIIINGSQCHYNESGISPILHSLGHILNEDFIWQEQYWGTNSYYNTRYLSGGINSGYIQEQPELSSKISNLATVTRKCFVAEVFNFLVNGKESSMVSKDQNNRDNILRQIKARYEWLGGPPVKWNIR